ncbi:hypothetical protein D3C76_1544890 [compost metagenome]
MQCSHLGTDPLRDPGCCGHVGVGQQHQKLLPAVATDHILCPQGTTDALGDLNQHDVTHVVAKGIVDPLEVIDIQHQQ